MNGPTISVRIGDEEFNISTTFETAIKQILVAFEMQSEGNGSG